MAVQFNGVDQGLSVAAPRSQFRNLAAASIALWARIETAIGASDRVFTKFSTATGSNTTRISFGLTTTLAVQVAVRILDADTLSIHNINLSTPPAAGEWHHYVVTVNYLTRNFQIYYDGALANNTVMTAPTAGNTSDTDSLTGGIGIANPPGGNGFWPGSIDDVRFFNRLLSPGEALTIFTTQGRDHIWAGATAAWPLNDLGVGVAVSNATDITGLGGAASPVGSPVFQPGITSQKGRMRKPMNRSTR